MRDEDWAALSQEERDEITQRVHDERVAKRKAKGLPPFRPEDNITHRQAARFAKMRGDVL